MTEMASETPSVRFSIDNDLCSGHGRCYALAPQWFDSDDVGYGAVKDELISADQRAQADNIVATCPEGAISLLTKSA